MQFLFRSSSFLMSSCSVRFATAWSMVGNMRKSKQATLHEVCVQTAVRSAETGRRGSVGSSTWHSDGARLSSVYLASHGIV
jgi:hypothetical protein